VSHKKLCVLRDLCGDKKEENTSHRDAEQTEIKRLFVLKGLLYIYIIIIKQGVNNENT